MWFFLRHSNLSSIFLINHSLNGKNNSMRLNHFCFLANFQNGMWENVWGVCFSQFKKIKNKSGAIVLHIKYLRQTMFRLICLHTHAHSPIYLAHLGFSRWSFGHAHSVQHHLKLLLKTRCALRSMFLKDSTETLRTITVPSHTRRHWLGLVPLVLFENCQYKDWE